MNNFKYLLDFEKSEQPYADEMYYKIFNGGNPNIIRYDYNDVPVGREMQKNGADLSIEIKNTSLNVSEKFRSTDWGDMFIELYSQYPKVNGWALTNQNVDIIAYHTPLNVYIVNNQDVKNLAKIFFDKLNKDDVIKALTNKDSAEFKYILNNESINATFRKVPTYINDKLAWVGIGVIISWEDLKKINIRYTTFKK